LVSVNTDSPVDVIAVSISIWNYSIDITVP